MGEIGIDPEMPLHQRGHRCVARRRDGGHSHVGRPVHVVLQNQGLGDHHARKKEKSVPRAATDHQRESDAKTRIPRRDRQAFVNVNEARPFEHDIGRHIQDGARPFRRVC